MSAAAVVDDPAAGAVPAPPPPRRPVARRRRRRAGDRGARDLRPLLALVARRAPAGRRRGAAPRPVRAGHRPPRRPGRSAPVRRLRPRRRARAGLRHRAGPPLADGPHAPPRARRAVGGLRRGRAPRRQGDPHPRPRRRRAPDAGPRAPAPARGARRLRGGRERLHRVARRRAAARVPAAALRAAALGAEDTVAVGKLLAMDLAQGWDGEAFRATVGDRLPPDVQEMLFPTLFAQDRILFGRDRAPPADARASAALEGDVAIGSNNWVVSGARTATGLPLLANDPHLGLGVPSIWTAVHLTAPGLDVAGVTLPGVPGVILGRNRDVAWGCTNVHDDGADLYVEEFDPRDPDRYRDRRRLGARDGPPGVDPRARRRAVVVLAHGRASRCASPATARWSRSAAASTPCAGRRWRMRSSCRPLPAPGRARGLGRVQGRAAPVPRAVAELRLRRSRGPHRVVLGGPPADPPRPGRLAAVRGRVTRRRLDRVRAVRGAAARRRSPVGRARHRQQPARGHRLSAPRHPRRHRPLARGRASRVAGGADGMDGRRHGAPAGRAPVDPAPRPGARAARRGGPPSRRRGVARGRGDDGAGGTAAWRRTAARRRWPSPPSAPSASARSARAWGHRPFASRSAAASPRSIASCCERPAAWVPAGDGDWDGLLLASWREGGDAGRGDARRRPRALDAGAR